MKAGSIKHLETVLAGFTDQAEAEAEAEARRITAVLVGVNELRQADAHLPSQDLDKAMNLAGITQRDDTVTQGIRWSRRCLRWLRFYRLHRTLSLY